MQISRRLTIAVPSLALAAGSFFALGAATPASAATPTAATQMAVVTSDHGGGYGHGGYSHRDYGDRYIHRDDSGEYAFRGVFHTVEQDKLIIQTFEWEGAPGEVCLEKASFEPTETGVRLSQHSVFPTVESRDASIEYGMANGINDSMDRLAELLAKES